MNLLHVTLLVLLTTAAQAFGEAAVCAPVLKPGEFRRAEGASAVVKQCDNDSKCGCSYAEHKVLCRYSVVTKQEIEDANYDTKEFTYIVKHFPSNGKFLSQACIKCDKADCLTPDEFEGSADSEIFTVGLKTTNDICENHIIEDAAGTDGDAFRKQFAVRHGMTDTDTSINILRDVFALFCLSDGVMQSLEGDDDDSLPPVCC